MVELKPHLNIDTLRAIYADLALIGDYVTDGVVLHKADPGRDGGHDVATGRSAVVAHECSLIDLAAGTLQMEVQHVVANDWFGAVLGVLRAYQGAVAMPFCGLWRFDNGRVAEHWENAYDAAALTDALLLAQR